MRDDKPVYPVSIAAEILGIHPRTLRLYEKYGLINPKRRSNKKLFSNSNLRWIQYIREMIHKKDLILWG